MATPICRICGTTFDLMHVLQGGQELLEKLRVCANIQIDFEGELPEHICLKCVQGLEFSYRLRKQGEAMEHKLRQKLQNENSVDLSDSIDLTGSVDYAIEELKEFTEKNTNTNEDDKANDDDDDVDDDDDIKIIENVLDEMKPEQSLMSYIPKSAEHMENHHVVNAKGNRDLLSPANRTVITSENYPNGEVYSSTPLDPSRDHQGIMLEGAQLNEAYELEGQDNDVEIVDEFINTKEDFGSYNGEREDDDVQIVEELQPYVVNGADYDNFDSAETGYSSGDQVLQLNEQYGEHMGNMPPGYGEPKIARVYSAANFTMEDLQQNVERKERQLNLAQFHRDRILNNFNRTQVDAAIITQDNLDSEIFGEDNGVIVRNEAGSSENEEPLQFESIHNTSIHLVEKIEVCSDDDYSKNEENAAGQEGFAYMGQEEQDAYVSQKEGVAYMEQKESVAYVSQEEAADYVDQKESIAYVGQEEAAAYVDQKESIAYVGQEEAAAYVDQKESIAYVGQEEAAAYVDQKESIAYVGQEEAAAYMDQKESVAYVGQEEAVACVGQEEEVTYIPDNTESTLVNLQNQGSLKISSNVLQTSFGGASMISAYSMQLQKSGIVDSLRSTFPPYYAKANHVCCACGGSSEYPPNDCSVTKVSVVFKCETCSMTFKTQVEYREHVKQHGRERFSCMHCSKWFPTRYRLQQHERIHNDNAEIFICTVCANRYRHPQNLKRHMRTAHSSEPYDPLQCGVCKEVFVHPDILKDHMSNHIFERNFTCELCSKSFKTMLYLVTHKRTHLPSASDSANVTPPTYTSTDSSSSPQPSDLTVQRSYLCAYCGKVSKHLFAHKNHLRTHSLERPYSCEFCSKTYRTLAAKLTHESIHNDVRPYQCSRCLLSFRLSSHLKTHQLKHDCITPYTCTVCNSAFAKKSHLKVHMRFHTGERPYSCAESECRQLFAKLSQLKRHAAQAHARDVDINEDEDYDDDVDEEEEELEDAEGCEYEVEQVGNGQHNDMEVLDDIYLDMGVSTEEIPVEMLTGSNADTQYNNSYLHFEIN